MSDGPTYRLRIQRAQARAREADARINVAKADLANARTAPGRWRAKLALFFAERDRASALNAAHKAKMRLMAMVI